MSDNIGRTVFDKVWDAHVVRSTPGEPDLLYVDLHLLHEATSPQAFESLRLAGRRLRRPDLTVATADHTTPTVGGVERADPLSRRMLELLQTNCGDASVRVFPLGHRHQGIVHVIGPELGLTQPGRLIVCGDSHTSTHGALGAMAFGIGTSEVEHVMATQCIRQNRPRRMAVTVEGDLPPGVTAKDVALGLIRQVGVKGGQGHAVEYRGSTIRALSMEGRLTLCNMTIEWGARMGMVAPDDTTFAFLAGRPFAPRGDAWEAAVARWRALASDEGAVYDAEVALDAARLEPFVTWGTTPGQVLPVSGMVPEPAAAEDERALRYMGLHPGERIQDVHVDRVFIGSCTNARLEDLRAAAAVARGRRVHPGVTALVVPGSASVKRAAEREGLDRVLVEAGFEWRNAGCSMCLGMNADSLGAGERCASTSNRNFEGRQGAGGRTHLVSPAMAAGAAVAGHFVDVREWAR
ncbi:MAG: 3-isopropylmalate dehydratase large subunit [Chloroflexi bacterium]|nr:MAG: 3-isopropylmalate dehydratase large subunit [Chloroflexota bacterium]